MWWNRGLRKHNLLKTGIIYVRIICVNCRGYDGPAGPHPTVGEGFEAVGQWAAQAQPTKNRDYLRLRGVCRLLQSPGRQDACCR